jgi:hypothetical protein
LSLFISWSGVRGRALALAVTDLFKTTLPGTHTWMSTDIRRGTPWAVELFSHLDGATACILCLTADSLRSPWIPFEAGAVLGASSGKATIVRLSLDVPQDRLQAGLLVEHPAFTCEQASFARLLDFIVECEQATPSELREIKHHWSQFEARLRGIPSVIPRIFDLVTWGPQGLVVTNVDMNQDSSWDALLRSCTQTESFPLSQDRWAELRYLDVDAMRWIPAPSRLSEVRLARLAVLHPDLEKDYLKGAQVSAMMLKESLDVLPATNRARATLYRDLEALMASQRKYLGDHGRYANSLEELDFLPAFGNEVKLTGGAKGWAAQATREETALNFGVRVGDGAGNFADRKEYQIFVT